MTSSASNATEFGEITQRNGHYAVQGHSRTAVSVPIMIRPCIIMESDLHPISGVVNILVNYADDTNLLVPENTNWRPTLFL